MGKVDPAEVEPHTQGDSVWVTTSDGRALHTMVLAGPDDTNAPTVVFESGAAASRSLWALVQPLVGQWSRAIVYDRSGFGRSAPDPGSRTLGRMADDLGELLDHFGDGPYVLVGHSAGGPIVRTAAAAAPGRITGLVLVDPTDEGWDTLFTPAFRRTERRSVTVTLAVARMKLLHMFFRSITAQLPQDARRDMQREGFTTRAMRTFAAQQRTYLDELSEYRGTPPDLGTLPVTVISAGLGGGGIDEGSRTAINEAHARSAARSPRGCHVVATESNHYVILSEPHLVADEIRCLLGDTGHGSDFSG